MGLALLLVFVLQIAWYSWNGVRVEQIRSVSKFIQVFAFAWLASDRAKSIKSEKLVLNVALNARLGGIFVV